MIKINDTVYIPYWNLKESKDFQGKRDEKDGIKVDSYDRKGTVVGINANSYIVQLTKTERIAVKKSMVYTDVESCLRYLQATGAGLDD